MKQKLLNQQNLTRRLRQLLVLFVLVQLPLGSWGQGTGAQIIYYPLSIDGTDLTSDNIYNFQGVSYENNSSTLSLDNATIGQIIWKDNGNLTIRLVGNNVIGGEQNEPLATAISSIYNTATLTFTSEINADNAPTGSLLFRHVTTPIDGFSSSNIVYENGLELGEIWDSSLDEYVMGVGKIDYGLNIGDIVVSSANYSPIKDYGGQSIGASYDKATNTLTLDDATLTDVISWSNEANFTINIIGTNSITRDGACITGPDNMNVSFTRGDANNPCSLVLNGEGSDVISGFSNSTNPTTGTGIYWVPTTISGVTSSATVTSSMSFPLYIGTTQVTTDNADDILNDGGKVKFSSEVNSTNNTTTYTLTLNGAAITAPVKIGLSNLTIDIKGTNTITTSETCIQPYGTQAASPSITFKSTSDVVGNLTLTNTNTNSEGVSGIGNVTISKELAPMLTVYGTEDYTSDMYYFTDGSTSVAKFVPSYGVKVGDLFVYEDNADNVFADGTVSFDKSTHTLTLNNASTGSISTSLSALTIELVGNNTLSSGSSSTFQSLTGDPVTMTIQSPGTPTGCLELNMSYSQSDVFVGNNVTVNITSPLRVVTGDLYVNSGNTNVVMISEPVDYDLVVNNVKVVAANASNITRRTNSKGRPVASFDASTNTLTFDGINLSYSTYNDYNAVTSNISGLKIKLVGNNNFDLASLKPFKYTGSGSETAPTLTFENEWQDNAYGTLTVKDISSVTDMLEGYTITNSTNWENAGNGSATAGWKYSESGSQVEIWYQDVYDLTVDGTKVTSRNMNDVLTSTNPNKVSFTPDDGTNGNILTLTGATLTSGIESGLDNLTIHLDGENVIQGSDEQNQLETGISSTVSTATLTFTSELDANSNNAPKGKLLFPYVNVSITGFASCAFNSGLDFISRGEEYTPVGATGSIMVNAVTNVTYFAIGTDVITSANCATTSITPAGGSGTISYDASNLTLTLDGVNTNLTINSYIEQDLTVAVKGTNSINTTTGVGGYCINSNISTRIKFIKGEDDSSLTLTSDDGHTVLNGFVNSTLPDLGSGINWVPSSQTSAIVTTNSSYILVGGYAITNGQTINGTLGTISYSESGSDKILTLTNFEGTFDNNAIETGIEGLTIKLVGTNTFNFPFAISYAVQGLQTNASVEFVSENNGNLTITSHAATPFNGFSDGKITYDGMTCYESSDQEWTIEVLPATPTIAFDANKTYLDTDEIEITNLGYTTIFYTWGNATIGTEYTHSADNPTLTEYNGTGVQVQNGTLRAWAGKLIEENRYLMSEAASQAFTIKKDIASCIVTLPESATYTGTAFVPTVKESSTSETALTLGTDFTVSYKKIVGTNETGVQSMTDAGTYKMTFTGTGNYGGTKEVTGFQIGQATPTLSFSSSTATIYFGNESAFVKPTLTTTPEGLEVTYEAGTNTTADVDETTGAITPLAIGDVVITATFEGNDNYISTNASYKLTVAKGTATITNAPAAKTLTYTSAALALVDAGTVSVGTLLYSKSLTGTFTESIPEETNAGTYTVYYKVEGTSNYNGIDASETNKVSVTINPASITEVTLTQTSFTYSGEVQTATVSAVKAGDLTLGTSDYAVSNNTATNKGSYTLTVTAKENGNFTGSKTADFTVNAKTLTEDMVSLLDESFEYNGETQEPAVTVADGNLMTENDYSITFESGKDVGTYYVTVTGKNNYTGEVNKSYEIVNRTLVINENGDIQFADGQIWASFYSTTESLQLPQGLMAYIVTAISSTSVTVKAINYVPKNVPVFLENNSTVTTTNSSAEGNLLKGTTASTPVSGISGTVYALHNNNLMQVTTGSIPEGRCYLEVNNASGARKLSIINDEGGSTSIQSLEVDKENDADEWYMMDGRKLQKKPTKEGLYIKNGMKVVIK
jgi:hypothetical protein